MPSRNGRTRDVNLTSSFVKLSAPRPINGLEGQQSPFPTLNEGGGESGIFLALRCPFMAAQGCSLASTRRVPRYCPPLRGLF